MPQGRPWVSILAAASFLLMAFSLYLIFMWVPTAQEEAGGIAQRIFYFHVPSAWVSFLAFFVTFVGGIVYLWKRDVTWDRLAYSSAEIGVLFTTLVLITGPIWAKPVWGAWWVWDPRLTTTLVLWLIYVAYLMVRAYAPEKEQGARFAAVVGIIGFFDVPIVFFAIRWWRTQHPQPVFESAGLAPEMLFTFLVSLAAFTALYFLLLAHRLALQGMADEVEEMQQILAE